MNKNIKIALIALTLLGIALLAFLFANNIGDGEGKDIVATDFEKHIQDRTYKEVKGLDYLDAKKGYDSILQEIRTESSVMLSNGQKSLTDDEVVNAERIVFYEYAPIFTEFGTSYFYNHSSWDDRTIKSLRADAVSLLSMDIAELGTKIHSQLFDITSTVDSYYSAWNVVNSASQCNSIDAIASLKSSASKYMKEPLTNNASLAAGLNSVESTAKSSVIRIISASCNGIANKYKSYSDYTAWTAAYENACSKIEEYKKSYGYPDELKRARAALDNADTEALSYFTSKETSNQ